jgi:hypothetical protein
VAILLLRGRRCAGRECPHGESKRIVKRIRKTHQPELRDFFPRKLTQFRLTHFAHFAHFAHISREPGDGPFPLAKSSRRGLLRS